MSALAFRRHAPYLEGMIDTPAFLDSGRPAVPDLVVPRGVLPFYLARRPVRGRLVRLGVLAEALIGRHDHGPAVSVLLGEALALVAGLATALKFRGSFSLQIKGDGPVSRLVADCTDTGALRGYVRVEAERLAESLVGGTVPTAERLLGQGVFALTGDQGPDAERQQGVGALAGPGLADSVRAYFASSEQHPVWLRLACAQTPAGWRAGALVLERIAGVGGVAPEMDDAAQQENWHTATLLAETLTGAELLDDALAPEQLLFNLFHEEAVTAGRARALAYGCRCSRQRLSGILEGFTPDELDEISVAGKVEMTCEFCNVAFHFPRAELTGRQA